MKTYKITFFEQNLEINSVVTFHNVVNQHEFLKLIATRIHTMELLPMVKCFCEDEDITIVFNKLLKSPLRKSNRLQDIEKIKVNTQVSYGPCHLHQ